MIAPTTLFLLRHAEVEARYQRVFGGRLDIDLSPRGHEQAASLARFLQSKRFDALYASPMRRVQQTLVPLAKGGAHPLPINRAELREVDFGDWTGLGWQQVEEKFGVSPFDWLRQLEMGTVPNGESAATFRARVEPCLREIISRHPGQSVAIACHGGTIRMILAILLELSLPTMSAFDVEYASLTEVQVNSTKVEVQLLNFTPWRDLAVI